MAQAKQEVCIIRIVFPVVSDDEALGYKKQIATMLEKVEEAQIHFSIMSGRNPIPDKPNGLT